MREAKAPGNRSVEDRALRDRLFEHLRRVEERLFAALEAAGADGEPPNATLARELRQYIGDVEAALDRQTAIATEEEESLEVTLEQVSRAWAEWKRREAE